MDRATRNGQSREAERLPRANVLGIGIHAVGMAGAVRRIADSVERRQKGYVCVTGVHGVMEAQRDPGLRLILNRAQLNLPDGMPTVWVGRLQRHAGIRRVFGPDLMAEVCRLSVERDYTHFFYGGAPGVADELRERLVARFPGLRVVGTDSPPFEPLTVQQRSALQQRIARLRPDLLWVGLGTPKQERFMAEHAESLGATVLLGVGAAFDYHTGRLRDAPRWMKKSGLQWAHRLAQEPRRLWRRYAVNNPAFVGLTALQLLGMRRTALDD